MKKNPTYNPEEFSDQKLIDEFQSAKNEALLEILFNRYDFLVMGILLKYLKNYTRAEEVKAIVYEKIWYKLSFMKPENYYAWLYSVTKNTCINELNKSATENRKFIEYMEEIKTNVPESNSRFYDDKEIHLRAALNKLQEDQKKCIVMFYMEDKSYKEIALLTGWELNKIKSLIQNGKRNLKLFLSNHVTG